MVCHIRIIQLDNQVTNNEMKRTKKITKLCGVKHSEQVHFLESDNNGLSINENWDSDSASSFSDNFFLTASATSCFSLSSSISCFLKRFSQ